MNNSLLFDVSQTPFFLIAGPCAIESRDMIMDAAGELKAMCEELNLPLIFKSSYDKANRASAGAGRGVGMDKGLEILNDARKQFALPVITDVHLPQHAAEVATVADVLQIPAFLCRQTDLITACAATGRALNIKKGQFVAPQDMGFAADKARAAGATTVMLCERGATFGYHDLVVDMRSLVWMRAHGCPIIFDATHSAQRPGAGNGVSGGYREMVAPLARAAVGVGVDGLFIETHPNPDSAISDAATQLPLNDLKPLLTTLLK